jgi:ribosome-binding factor A
MAGKGETNRPERVAARITEELMSLILRGAIKDPDAGGAVVTAVTVTRDLRIARVFLRLGDPQASEAQKKKLLRAFGRANGFLRRTLADRLEMRHTPELVFEWDATVERAQRIEELLHEIREENGEKKS